MRASEEYRTTDHPTVYNRLRRIFTLVCAYCRPHRYENLSTVRKHGVRKKRKAWR